MKLLTTYTDIDEAQNTAWNMRQNGILTYVSSTNSKRLGSVFTGVFSVGLWVVIDTQLHDAIQLLENPNHTVIEKLTEEEIQNLEQQANEQYKESISSGKSNLGNKIAIILAILLLIFIAYKIISTI